MPRKYTMGSKEEKTANQSIQTHLHTLRRQSLNDTVERLKMTFALVGLRHRLGENTQRHTVAIGLPHHGENEDEVFDAFHKRPSFSNFGKSDMVKFPIYF